MAGILDVKTRILDSVVTEIGRSQISTGRLRVEYASLTDGATYYEDNGKKVPTDASLRLYFESPGRKKQDFITFETDDSGALIGYPVDEITTIVGDEIFQEEPSSSELNSLKIVSSSNFASVTSGIVTSSIDHWNELRVIGTLDSEEDLSRSFETSRSDCNFTIMNTFPFKDGAVNNIIDADELDCLFLNDKLSHIPNFKFLPPMVVEPNTTAGGFNYILEKNIQEQRGQPQRFLGDYEPLTAADGARTSMSTLGGPPSSSDEYNKLMSHLNGPNSQGVDPESFSLSDIEPILPWFSEDTVIGDGATIETQLQVNRERASIEFIKTSLDNNLVMQMFETNSDTLKFTKLDVIDFGEFVVDENRSTKRVFFAGKVFLNSYNVPTFANLFTIIMD